MKYTLLYLALWITLQWRNGAMIMTVQKIVVSSKNQVKVVDTDLPQLSARSVQVKGILSGISHATELAVIEQTTPTFLKHWDAKLRCFVPGEPSKQYPASLGYEYVGQVEVIGSAVTELQPGDYVWVDAAHQTQHVINLDQTPYLKLAGPDSVELAAFLALTRVALAAVHDAHLNVGEIAFVSGLGTVGLITVQLLKLAGVKQIFAADPISLRRQRAESYGAICFDPSQVDPAVELKQRFSAGADVAFECSGSTKALHTAIKACAMGGRVVTVATYRDEARGLYLGEEWHRNRITLLSSMSVNGNPHRDAPLWNLSRLNRTALELLENRTLKVTDLITQRFPFVEAAIAYRHIQQQPETTLKVVFTYA